MKHNRALAVAGAALLLFAGLPAWSADQADVASLAEALPGATVSLRQGLELSHREGMPICAKYEITDGVLQLSVYTMNLGQFMEVIVDIGSGAIKKSDAIIDGSKLKVAGVQGAVLSRARMSLEDVVGNALRAIPGYRAVSIAPELENGHPIATTTLLKGRVVREVIETLD